MNITYSHNGRSITKEIKGPYSSFLCSDGYGSYFSQGIKKNYSFYQGFANRYPEDDVWTLFTFIERLMPEREIIELQQTILQTTLVTRKGSVSFSCSDKNTLEIRLSELQELHLTIDPRKIYDFSTDGRTFRFFIENGIQFIEYTKKNSCEEYNLYLGIIGGTIKNEQSGVWVPRDYEYDKQRNNATTTQYVYDGLVITPIEKTIHCIQGRTKEEIVELAKQIGQSDQQRIKVEPTLLCSNDEEYLAYLMSLKSLNDLLIDTAEGTGIYAGFYWFFHYWTRDEAITLGGLIAEKTIPDVVKKILLRMFSKVGFDGRMPNRFPPSLLGTSDGGGWAVKRFFDAIDLFSESEREQIIDTIEESVKRLLEHHTMDDFEINDDKETWMDTTGGVPDTRSGMRIEMQALRLLQYRELSYVRPSASEHYKQLEAVLREKVKDLLFDGKRLADGATYDEEQKRWVVDTTQRPNIFLAYYLYPELLTANEWERVFDSAIEALWLEWGGFATIDKKHPWFKESYTGENNASYHRGDSWFFVNHLAAIAMHSLNADKYKENISKILEATKQEIFQMGILGANAEISSAEKLRPEGTWQQAWSMGTFIELIHRVHRDFDE